MNSDSGMKQDATGSESAGSASSSTRPPVIPSSAPVDSDWFTGRRLPGTVAPLRNALDLLVRLALLVVFACLLILICRLVYLLLPLVAQHHAVLVAAVAGFILGGVFRRRR